MASAHILVVEDDPAILELISFNLTRGGYRVTPALTAEEAMAAVSREIFDLVVLDIMLPGADGLELCRRLRSQESTRAAAIIMVTARGEEADIVRGLECGADDYVPKPFSPRVLLARVRAVLRRRTGGTAREEPRLVRGDLEIHSARHEARLGGQVLPLTSTEFRLLEFLARHAGWVYTRSQIVDAIRGPDYYVTDRSVDVLVFGLRRKLGAHAGLIETVRGVGYRFKEG